MCLHLQEEELFVFQMSGGHDLPDVWLQIGLHLHARHRRHIPGEAGKRKSLLDELGIHSQSLSLLLLPFCCCCFVRGSRLNFPFAVESSPNEILSLEIGFARKLSHSNQAN